MISCKQCGEEYCEDRAQCFIKMMETKKGRKALAAILDEVVSTANCRADNNEERLMIYRAAVRHGEILKAVLRGQETKELCKDMPYLAKGL